METSSDATAVRPISAVPPQSPPPPGPDDGEPVPPARDEAPRWSRVSVAALTTTAALLACALVTHLGMLFLSVAPPNALTVEHHDTVDAYVQPEFGQDWKLFAPNPMQRNEAVGARVNTLAANGRPRASEWINLTDRDIETIRGNPAPSHVDQNMLRRAWDTYIATHSVTDDRPKGARGTMARDYLKRVVLQRLGRTWQGERIVSLQVGGRFTMVDPPAWSSEQPSDTTEYRLLPWWTVTDQDHRSL
ncbi:MULTISPECIES: DUF5819 family protein [unclassified Streptomyces]|uniref:DUF5819 family protein n=1 Tax=unclassified Streptomyces TaxID=2593676 RepID=UPI002966A215|nr:DUF5819 family protein [Streptomyces sp. SJL17-1]